MVKAVVVAADYNQFATYIRNRGFVREMYGYYRAGKPEDCLGLDNDTVAVHWLDGWSDNETLTTSDIVYLKEKFTTHKNISERRIYNEGFSF